MSAHTTNRFPGRCACGCNRWIPAGEGTAVKDPGSDRWTVRCADGGDHNTRRCDCGKPAILRDPSRGDLCRDCCLRAGVVPEVWR